MLRGNKREGNDRVSSRDSGPDETNSKRDVLLIILTSGVRLNERRSQTREAPCKFNYREKERAMKIAEKGRMTGVECDVKRKDSEDGAADCSRVRAKGV